MFLDADMIQGILEATNQKGTSKHGSNWNEMDETELFGWIGIHIKAGINHDGFRPVHELFSSKDGPPIYGATMSRDRFNEIKENIRFDNLDT